MYRGGIIRKTPEQLEAMAAAGAIQAALPEDARVQVPRPGSPPRSSTRPPRSSSPPRAPTPPSRATAASPARSAPRPTRWSSTASPVPTSCRRATSSRSTSASPTRAGSPTPRSPSRSGRSAREAQNLLRTTRASLFEGIAQARPGNRLSDIGHAVQTPGRARRPLGDPLAGRPRDRPRHARGPADPQLRRAGQGPRARGGDGAGDRADGQRRRRRRPDGQRRLGRLLRRTTRSPPTSSSPSRSPPTAPASSPPGTSRSSSRASPRARARSARSGFGAHQLRSPSSAISDGTSIARTIVESIRTATARPKPVSLTPIRSAGDQGAHRDGEEQRRRGDQPARSARARARPPRCSTRRCRAAPGSGERLKTP